MADPILSVIVCSYNGQDLLPTCLGALSNQTIDKSLYEVIVVDNNSTDSTGRVSEEIAKKNINFKVVNEPQIGLSYARNRGWQEAKGVYVAYIDDDAKAVCDWCENIISAFKTVNPQPVAVGGEILPWYESQPPDWFTDDFEIRSWGRKPKFLKNQYGFSGSNMAFLKDVLAKFDGFSSDFGMVGDGIRLGEEADLFYRIYSEKPYLWYDPKIRVYHWVSLRNMSVRYRLWRSYKVGVSSVLLRGRKVFSLDYLKKWGYFFLLLLKAPYILLKDRNKRSMVVTFCELAKRLGYLIGRK